MMLCSRSEKTLAAIFNFILFFFNSIMQISKETFLQILAENLTHEFLSNTRKQISKYPKRKAMPALHFELRNPHFFSLVSLNDVFKIINCVKREVLRVNSPIKLTQNRIYKILAKYSTHFQIYISISCSSTYVTTS